MLDAERCNAVKMEDFVVLSTSEYRELMDKIAQLEASIISIKRAAANGAWCRRNHNNFC